MENEVTKGSNGQMNYTSGQGGGFWSYIDSLPLRYVGNRFYTGEYVADLEEEIEKLKIGMEHDKRKYPIKAECETKHQFAFRVEGEAVVRCQECYKCLNDEQYFTSLEEEIEKLKKETKNKNINELAQELGMILFNFSNSCKNPEHILRIKIKDGLIKNASIIYEDIEEVSLIEKENKTLKFQLQELNQANVNLFNECEKLNKEVNKTNLISDLDNQYFLQAKKHLDRVHELEDLNSKLFNKNQELESKIKSHELDIDKFQYTGYRINKIKELTEQLELKEAINQDLVKKYQLLEEEIQVYDINMLELVEGHSKLEQDYKELQKQSSECNLRFQIERLTKKLDSHKENFKKYEQHIYIGDKILDIINKVDAQSYNIILTIKDRLISSVELNEFNQEKYDKALEKIKQLEHDYNELSKNMLQGLKVNLQHRVKPYLSEGVINVIVESNKEFK